MRDRTEFKRVGLGVYRYKGYTLTRHRPRGGPEYWTARGGGLAETHRRTTRAALANLIDQLTTTGETE